MAGVNKAIIVGNLGRDPEVKSFPNGGRVVSLNIATSETWKDKSTGEKKERTEWHRVSIFNEALGKIAEQYLKKGSTVYLEGQIETRKWQDQSGADKYSTEVVLRAFGSTLVMLDGPGEKREHTNMPPGYESTAPAEAHRGRAMDHENPF